MIGAAHFVKAGMPGPAGFTKIGSFVMNEGEKKAGLSFDVYQKN
jgi:hypothetical protein